jgi:hypothetical protein
LDASGVGEGFGERGQERLEIVGGKDMDLSRRGLDALRLGDERHKEQAEKK